MYASMSLPEEEPPPCASLQRQHQRKVPHLHDLLLVPRKLLCMRAHRLKGTIHAQKLRRGSIVAWCGQGAAETCSSATPLIDSQTANGPSPKLRHPPPHPLGVAHASLHPFPPSALPLLSTSRPHLTCSSLSTARLTPVGGGTGWGGSVGNEESQK
jgi:hypothetical protein